MPDEVLTEEYRGLLLAHRQIFATVPEIAKKRMQPIDVHTMVHDMDASGVDKTVVFGVPSKRIWRNQGPTNKMIADFVSAYPDRLIGFAGYEAVDEKGRVNLDGLKQLRRDIKDYNFKGVKCAPLYGQYQANDRRAYPFYAMCLELGVVIMFHMGVVNVKGLPLEYANPIVLDDVMEHFPDLKIQIAHLGIPWTEETFSIMQKFETVYGDLGGLFSMPNYLTWNLVLAKEYGVLDRILFATDGPGVSWPQKPRVEFMRQKLNEKSKASGWGTFTTEDIDGILGGNAKKLLKL